MGRWDTSPHALPLACLTTPSQGLGLILNLDKNSWSRQVLQVSTIRTSYSYCTAQTVIIRVQELKKEKNKTKKPGRNKPVIAALAWVATKSRRSA